MSEHETRDFIAQIWIVFAVLVAFAIFAPVSAAEPEGKLGPPLIFDPFVPLWEQDAAVARNGRRAACAWMGIALGGMADKGGTVTKRETPAFLETMQTLLDMTAKHCPPAPANAQSETDE